jgi:hypothetical protein
MLSTAGDALTTHEQGSSGSKHQPKAELRGCLLLELWLFENITEFLN